MTVSYEMITVQKLAGPAPGGESADSPFFYVGLVLTLSFLQNILLTIS